MHKSLTLQYLTKGIETPESEYKRIAWRIAKPHHQSIVTYVKKYIISFCTWEFHKVLAITSLLHCTWNIFRRVVLHEALLYWRVTCDRNRIEKQTLSTCLIWTMLLFIVDTVVLFISILRSFVLYLNEKCINLVLQRLSENYVRFSIWKKIFQLSLFIA